MVNEGKGLDKTTKHNLLIVVSMAAILLVSIFILNSYMPSDEEKFFAMGILGENKRAEKYYPNDDPNITVGTMVRWYIYIYNHMESPQNLSIRVKILNSTSPGPDDSKHEPSPIPALYEIRQELTTNETLLLPFFWYISEVNYRNGSVTISQLVINGLTMNSNVYSSANNSFRIIFELWVYNDVSKDYEYVWKSGEESLSIGLTMWFNLATSK
jgi:hypothetical protein